MENRPPSRPTPLSFQPPQGAVVELRYVRSLMCTIPASIFMPSSMARSRSCVSTAAERPNTLSLHLASASSAFFTGMTLVTGAKLSS